MRNSETEYNTSLASETCCLLWLRGVCESSSQFTVRISVNHSMSICRTTELSKDDGWMARHRTFSFSMDDRRSRGHGVTPPWLEAAGTAQRMAHNRRGAATGGTDARRGAGYRDRTVIPGVR